jgi:hypothetical protein
MSYKIAAALNRFQSNVHSQNGEDGVIAEILRRLGIVNDDDKWCVEFGAWDGVHLSNTFALVEKDWNAVYIEGDNSRYQDLLATAQRYPRIHPIHAYVARCKSDENALERLLAQTPAPKEFELLSIDIDSFDLDVWDSLSDYSPKIVIIEINSQIPPGIVWRHSSEFQGNTFSATINLGREKGYSLVCHTGNCIFVRNDLVDKIKLEPIYLRYPELLFLYQFLEDSPWLPNRRFVPRRASLERFTPRILRSLITPLKPRK